MCFIKDCAEKQANVWKKVYDWVKGVKNFKIFWMNNKAILLNSAIIDYYIRFPFIYILNLGLVRVGTCV